jgi:hypothetical protein
MGEHNSPAFAQGRDHKLILNVRLQACPPVTTTTYDPSAWGRYTVMYNKGWDSEPTAEEHSCERCKPGERP